MTPRDSDQSQAESKSGDSKVQGVQSGKSKIQTLKLASDYIDFLYNVLKAGEVDESGQINSNGDPSLSLNYAFNMWRMQDVWNSNHRHQSSPEEDLSWKMCTNTFFLFY